MDVMLVNRPLLETTELLVVKANLRLNPVAAVFQPDMVAMENY